MEREREKVPEKQMMVSSTLKWEEPKIYFSWTKKIILTKMSFCSLIPIYIKIVLCTITKRKSMTATMIWTNLILSPLLTTKRSLSKAAKRVILFCLV